MVTVKEAAWILGISDARIRLLLKTDRIAGAEKIDGCWQIPLGADGIPVISKGKRGPEATWNKARSTNVQTVTRIHVNQKIIRSNFKLENPDPPILVRRFGKVESYHEVKIVGSCKIIYKPSNPLSSNARVWIEVDKNSTIVV